MEWKATQITLRKKALVKINEDLHPRICESEAWKSWLGEFCPKNWPKHVAMEERYDPKITPLKLS